MLASAKSLRGDRRWRENCQGFRIFRDEAGKLIPIDIRAGDRVLFGKWSGTEVKIDGEDLLIMKESDIFGVIEEGVAKKKAA